MIFKYTKNNQPDNEQLTYLHSSITASEMLLTFLNDILDFSKVEAGKLSMENVIFDIHSTIKDTISIFQLMADEKNINLITNICDDLPVYLIGDHSRISQILNNLISNAIKFTNNGYIKTRVNYKKLADHKIKLIFTVKDTGIGIKKDSLTQIFQPFTQEDLSTTRKFGGTGLGLAICKQLVHLMNGDIFVKSIVGKGSIFKFSIILDTPVKNTEYKVNTYQTNNKILLKENFIKNISEISKVTNNITMI